MMRTKWFVISVLTIALLALATSGWAEKKTVEGMAPWEAGGQVFMTGPDELMFQGDFEGILYLESEKGPLDGILLMCPATYTVDLKENTVVADGKCILTGEKGNMVFADWECKGSRGSCKGEMTLTGGTGPFEGITGSGKMAIRTVLSVLAADLDNGEMVSGAAGLAFWPELTYKIPGK